ncbi:MAG: DUF1598 domain-containing protein [Pirellulaceae bacterium]|nr:DUF1598 domain-containing protein [Pirellulaceae bacterium]
MLLWSQSAGFRKPFLALAIGAVVLLTASQFSHAQVGGGGFFNRVVGGIKVDANNVLVSDFSRLTDAEIVNLAKSIEVTDPSINQAGMRAVSVRGIESALATAMANQTPLPPEIQFMAGLTRIEFVVVKPENNDILLVGPADGWKVNDQGAVVSRKTGEPVLLLEDFLIAMRTVDNARADYGISIDIRPSEEGMKEYLKLQRQITGPVNNAVAANIEATMGPQPVTVTGVPLESRYASVLFRADYRLKQLSMGMTQAPINKFPSMMEMLANRGGVAATTFPRFWLECNYDAIGRSDDGMSFKLSGQGVKAATEETYYTRDGKVSDQKSAKKNKTAEAWAEMMTERFEELSAADHSFRELRNIMDMSVVAALIAREGLLQKAGVEIPEITQLDSAVTTPVWHNPEYVPSKCVFVGNLMSVSGGIQVDSWAVANHQKADSTVNAVADKARNVEFGQRFYANLSMN